MGATVALYTTDTWECVLTVHAPAPWRAFDAPTAPKAKAKGGVHLLDSAPEEPQGCHPCPWLRRAPRPPLLRGQAIASVLPEEPDSATSFAESRTGSGEEPACVSCAVLNARCDPPLVVAGFRGERTSRRALALTVTF